MDRLRHRTRVGGNRTCSYLESKTEPSVAKAQDYMGGTPHTKKPILGVGGTPHILS